MNVKLNLGMWNNIFAIPCDIVDKYIKTAAHKQLQILLYLLRHSNKDFSLEDLAQEFNMHVLDVKDCITYWEQEGLIIKSENEYIPKQDEKEVTRIAEEKEVIKEVKKEIKAKKVLPSKREKPDMIHVSARLDENEELQNLMQEAQTIMSRLITQNEIATLVMMHDQDGLPLDVIIMIMQFAKSQGKNGFGYIEKIGMDWSNQGIDTIDKAEEKIIQIAKQKENWSIVSRIFGIANVGSPTETQMNYANKWLSEWKYSKEMIRKAYEVAIDTKGKYDIRYINGVIKNWHKLGVYTLKDYEQLSKQNEEKKEENKKQTLKNSKKENELSSYNLSDFDDSDLFDF